MATRLVRLSDGSGWRVVWSRCVPYLATPGPDHNPAAGHIGRLSVETMHDFPSRDEAECFRREVERGDHDIADEDAGDLGEATTGYERRLAAALQQ